MSAGLVTNKGFFEAFMNSWREHLFQGRVYNTPLTDLIDYQESDTPVLKQALVDADISTEDDLTDLKKIQEFVHIYTLKRDWEYANFSRGQLNRIGYGNKMKAQAFFYVLDLIRNDLIQLG